MYGNSTPRQALRDPRTLPYQAPETVGQFRQRQQFADMGNQALGGQTGYADRNQVREFGGSLLEATGAPSWARAIDDLSWGDPGSALPEIGMGVLQTGSLATLPYGAGPSRALPRDIRRALPRGATHANTHEVAAAAESAGYDGVTFSGIRDSGYGGAMDAYPGFETGDPGRTVTLFRDNVVRSPFPEQPQLPRTNGPDASAPQSPGGGAGGGIQAYHGGGADIEGGQFRQGSHFGTSDAANRRLADNSVTDGGRIYPVELPEGRYLRVPDTGNQWRSARYWQEHARRELNASVSPEDRALWRAIENDRELSMSRGNEVTARLGQIMREHGYEGAIYRNRWEGGDSYFMPDSSGVKFRTASPNEGPPRKPIFPGRGNK